MEFYPASPLPSTDLPGAPLVRDDAAVSTGSDYIDRTACFLFGAIRRAQLNALASVAADPLNLVPIFESAGGSAALFAGLNDGALLAIYVAFEHARDRLCDRLFAAECARYLLRHTGHWSDDDHWGFGSTWTVKRLGRLFESYYPCPAIVAMHALQLIDLDRRLSGVRANLDEVHRLLTPTIDDWRHHAEQLLRGRSKTALLGKAVA